MKKETKIKKETEIKEETQKKRNFSGQKKTNHATSRDKKKSLNLSVPKKSRNLSGQKNHATYWYNKKSRNHLGEKMS